MSKRKFCLCVYTVLLIGDPGIRLRSVEKVYSELQKNKKLRFIDSSKKKTIIDSRQVIRIDVEYGPVYGNSKNDIKKSLRKAVYSADVDVLYTVSEKDRKVLNESI